MSVAVSISDLQSQCEEIQREFQTSAQKIRQSPEPQQVEELRLAFLGRKGKVTALMDYLK